MGGQRTTSSMKISGLSEGSRPSSVGLSGRGCPDDCLEIDMSSSSEEEEYVGEDGLESGQLAPETPRSETYGSGGGDAGDVGAW